MVTNKEEIKVDQTDELSFGENKFRLVSKGTPPDVSVYWALVGEDGKEVILHK